MQLQSPIHEQRENIEKQIEVLTNEMTRLKRVNRNWDAGLTITTIILTLFITILSNVNTVKENDRRIITNIIGGVIVAIQSLNNAFPVKQRAGSYRLLQAQAGNLLLDVRHVESLEELHNIEVCLFQLQTEAAKVEM
ncbi:hypothetical protein DSM106972_031070 [Dulcicalothrix desertica PCC 7102]|uniref:DUF4231 domain-containing protein n=1 Tax=Dulcicalothrix desertica PCC 7102 TaxID=232991 RepID=A0A433VIG9_9CYAN|nr:hypothetical protein [Dulcicalothrix desertica]RUT05901.1 hypothetical protein DSM106972_031070 [Dulcicalothrix desertica PCC 7102]TWH54402.1 hypothetical protein CAL7102_02433 [Dulcicalothrix desertica PCC 7102]